MRYQKLNRFSDSEFKRLVGVPRHVFNEMVEVLEKAESLKKKSVAIHRPSSYFRYRESVVINSQL